MHAYRGNVFYRISTYERRQAGLLPELSNRSLRHWYRKTTSKSISFGLEEALAVYLHKALMDLLFLPSVLPQVYNMVVEIFFLMKSIWFRHWFGHMHMHHVADNTEFYMQISFLLSLTNLQPVRRIELV